MPNREKVKKKNIYFQKYMILVFKRIVSIFENREKVSDALR
jgi:hypothetical protein